VSCPSDWQVQCRGSAGSRLIACTTEKPVQQAGNKFKHFDTLKEESSQSDVQYNRTQLPQLNKHNALIRMGQPAATGRFFVCARRTVQILHASAAKTKQIIFFQQICAFPEP
jgi:hypothetical protein